MTRLNIVACVLLAGSVTAAFAGHPATASQERQNPFFIARHQKELALSREQYAQIEELTASFSKDLKLRQDELREARKVFSAAIRQRDCPPAVLRERSRKVLELQERIRALSIEVYDKERAVLTPGQQASLDRLIKTEQVKMRQVIDELRLRRQAQPPGMVRPQTKQGIAPLGLSPAGMDETNGLAPGTYLPSTGTESHAP